MKFMLFLGLLGGCAGMPDELALAVDSWRGASLEEVTQRWGPPVRTRVLADGAREHTWYSEDYRRIRPSAGVVIGSGGAVVGGNVPFGAAGPAVRCDRSLVFRDGVAAGGRWIGPYDYCNIFRR
ncbi:MAG: hypothetical protein ACT4P4_02885 [Betaproteobacteria bacterium]